MLAGLLWKVTSIFNKELFFDKEWFIYIGMLPLAALIRNGYDYSLLFLNLLLQDLDFALIKLTLSPLPFAGLAFKTQFPFFHIEWWASFWSKSELIFLENIVWLFQIASQHWVSVQTEWFPSLFYYR